MPLSHKLVDEPGHLLYLWYITEATSQLQSIFNNVYKDLVPVEQFGSEIRQREWLAVRLLVAEILGHPTRINYLRKGCPFLPDESFNISISHAKNWVGVQLLADKPAGLDMEIKSDKIRRIAPKFMNNIEIMNSDDSLDYLYKVWCSKEVLFKVHQNGNVDFKRDLTISLGASSIEGEIKNLESSGRYSLSSVDLKELIIIYHSPQ